MRVFNMPRALLMTSASSLNWFAKASQNILHWVLAKWARPSDSRSIWACLIGTTTDSMVSASTVDEESPADEESLADEEDKVLVTSDASCATL